MRDSQRGFRCAIELSRPWVPLPCWSRSCRWGPRPRLPRPPRFGRCGVSQTYGVFGISAPSLPLERSDALADQAFLTEEEAANLEQEVVDRNLRLLNRPAERTVASD